jgi:Tol biopolymer transport system component
MVDIGPSRGFARRVPWRPITVLTMILLLLAACFALLFGSRHALPAPFGLARNGLVAYAMDGDIYTVDSRTGKSTAIVQGPETDINPRWSRDGTRIAFERKVSGTSGPGSVYVVKQDGSDLIRVTQDNLSDITGYTFSPEGDRILISINSTDGLGQALVASTDGSQVRRLDIPLTAADPAWRPPDGSEVLFSDSGDPSSTYRGIYAVNVADGNIRTVLKPADGLNRGLTSWSPDGSLIAYGEWVDADQNTIQIHIMAANGTSAANLTSDRTLPLPHGAMWQGPFGWSNDGTRLIAIRGYAGDEEKDHAVVIPIDLSGPGTEIKSTGVIQAACCSVWEWAPDDSSILGTPLNSSGDALDQVLLDPTAGTSRSVSWKSVSQPSWQRLAP